jgi:hypothetical protein
MLSATATVMTNGVRSFSASCEPLGLGHADLDLPLAVGPGEGQPGPAHRLDPPGAVDLLDGEHEPVHDQAAVERERPRRGMDVADLELARLGAEHGRKSEGDGPGGGAKERASGQSDGHGILLGSGLAIGTGHQRSISRGRDCKA